MRKFIASLDVGSSLLKLIVGEVVKDKVNILACVDTPSRGIKKGYVINTESATECFKELFQKCESILDVKIRKVIVSVPSFYSECFLEEVKVTPTNADRIIKNDDIVNAISLTIKDKIPDNRRVVSVQPSVFKINGENVNNPLNMLTDELIMKSVVVTVPEKNIIGIKTCLENIGVNIEDVIISPLADYYEARNKEINKMVGAIINIGEETTTVSIINKGILTNMEVIDIGGANITNDLSYVYKINKDDATYLKEHIALSHTRLAQPNESITFTDKHGDMVKINQYDASEIVMGRMIEIINLAKKQINLLTKKEISYIIVTGGVTESQDFDILIEELFGNIAIINKVEEIGARSNKYATSIGMIKYFNSRLKLKNEKYSILTEDEEEQFGLASKRINLSENTILGKLFNYFFDSD